MKTENSKKLIRLVIVSALVVAFFVGLSFVGSDKQNAQKLAFDASGYNKAYALESN